MLFCIAQQFLRGNSSAAGIAHHDLRATNAANDSHFTFGILSEGTSPQNHVDLFFTRMSFFS